VRPGEAVARRRWRRGSKDDPPAEGLGGEGRFGGVSRSVPAPSVRARAFTRPDGAASPPDVARGPDAADPLTPCPIDGGGDDRESATTLNATTVWTATVVYGPSPVRRSKCSIPRYRFEPLRSLYSKASSLLSPVKTDTGHILFTPQLWGIARRIFEVCH